VLGADTVGSHRVDAAGGQLRLVAFPLALQDEPREAPRILSPPVLDTDPASHLAFSRRGLGGIVRHIAHRHSFRMTSCPTPLGAPATYTSDAPRGRHQQVAVVLRIAMMLGRLKRAWVRMPGMTL